MLSRLGRPVQWALLAPLSLLLGWLLTEAGLPAAFLLGPMLVGIVFGSNGSTIKVHTVLYRAAQTVISLMIVSSLSTAVLAEFYADGFMFLGVIVLMLAGSAMVGLLLMRLGIFPGTTALWGCWPGGASAMVIMAKDYGGDQQLVAFMQYLRVIIVSLLAAAVAFWWAGPFDVPKNAPALLGPVDWPSFAATAALGVACLLVTLKIKRAGLSFILPLFAGLALKFTGLLDVSVPYLVSLMSFIALGWYIGLGFRRETLLHAWRALPQVIAAIFAIVALSAALAYLLHTSNDVDMLTAYLATSPGGLDTVAIIAATTHSDVSFILSLQLMRLLILLTIGPYLARLLMLRHKPPGDAPPTTPMD